MIFLPVATLPVNEILRTSGWPESSAPTLPGPAMTLITPAGRMSFSISATINELSGVNSDGLATTVLPASSAGANFHASSTTGKFHGVMIEQTPSGWRTDIANLFLNSEGTVWPNMRRPSPAM